MIKNSNLDRLLLMVKGLDELKDDMYKTIEYYLDNEKNEQVDDHIINLMESKMDDLKMTIEFAGDEFKINNMRG